MAIHVPISDVIGDGSWEQHAYYIFGTPVNDKLAISTISNLYVNTVERFPYYDGVGYDYNDISTAPFRLFPTDTTKYEYSKACSKNWSVYMKRGFPKTLFFRSKSSSALSIIGWNSSNPKEEGSLDLTTINPGAKDTSKFSYFCMSSEPSEDCSCIIVYDFNKRLMWLRYGNHNWTQFEFSQFISSNGVTGAWLGRLQNGNYVTLAMSQIYQVAYNNILEPPYHGEKIHSAIGIDRTRERFVSIPYMNISELDFTGGATHTTSGIYKILTVFDQGDSTVIVFASGTDQSQNYYNLDIAYEWVRKGSCKIIVNGVDGYIASGTGTIKYVTPFGFGRIKKYVIGTACSYLTYESKADKSTKLAIIRKTSNAIYIDYDLDYVPVELEAPAYIEEVYNCNTWNVPKRFNIQVAYSSDYSRNVVNYVTEVKF